MFSQFDELAHDAFTKQLDQRCGLYKAVVPDTNSARSELCIRFFPVDLCVLFLARHIPVSNFSRKSVYFKFLLVFSWTFVLDSITYSVSQKIPHLMTDLTYMNFFIFSETVKNF